MNPTVLRFLLRSGAAVVVPDPEPEAPLTFITVNGDPILFAGEALTLGAT